MHKRWLTSAVAAVALLAACDRPGRESGNAAKAPPAGEERSLSRFVNDRDDLSGELLRRYVDFSFSYPSDWQRTTGRGNFVQVSPERVDGMEPFAFSVSHAEGTGNSEADRRGLQLLLPQLERQLAGAFQDFRVAWRGPSRVGRYDSVGMGFEGSGEPQNGGARSNIVGRIDLIVPPGARRGVTLFTIISDRSNETLDADDIGESGPIADIYESLRIGDDAGS